MVESTDVRSAAERAEAKRVAASDHKLANDMRRDRLADQAANANRGAANLAGNRVTAVDTSASAHSRPTKHVVVLATNKRKKAAVPLANGRPGS